MTSEQQQKITDLIDKYNDILLNSMRLAVAEDFINLIILNRDDSNFELKDFLQEKDKYYTIILREFLKKNSSPITSELKHMSDPELKGFRERRNSKKKSK